MSYEILLQMLWDDYTKRNPQALKIYQLFKSHHETIINDHIALRTCNHPKVTIDKLAQLFIKYGYQEKQHYDFPLKKLFAKHYEHPDPAAPKLFISELLMQKCSVSLQRTLNDCITAIPEQLVAQDTLLSSGALWLPRYHRSYLALLAESEYAAWFYAFGFCANHFTINVNALTHFTTLDKINQLLQQHGITLNTVGGAIKGSPAEYLEQSSTQAEAISVTFEEGTFAIPSCYYEFAKRYPLANGQLYTGFVAASADKIFESTDTKPLS